jgi:ABC-type molybdenum transport system ATPase subunit/photorepair protein PhrA
MGTAVRRNGRSVILGDNGTGKTTLLQCLAALEEYPVQLGDEDLVIPRVHGDPSLAWGPSRSASPGTE